MSTGIEWTDETWSPVRGCTRVSEGCRNCYAEEAAAGVNAKLGAKSPYVGLVRLEPARQIQVDLATGKPTGKVRDRMRARWTGAVAFDPVTLAKPLSWRKPQWIFVNSMSDLFHDGFTDEQIAAVFGVMAATPQHTYIVLTKRAERMRRWFEWLERRSLAGGGGAECEICVDHADEVSSKPVDDIVDGRWPLPNVILGVSAENQATADERIPHLLATPAAVRAVSAEPLLGPIDLLSSGIWKIPSRSHLHWVIAGCESGRNARPCEVEWLRSLRDQCVKFGTPFFLKQARADCGCPWSHAHNDVEGCESCSCTWSPGDVGSVESGVVARTDDQIKYDHSNNRLGALVSLPYLDGVQWTQRPEVRR